VEKGSGGEEIRMAPEGWAAEPSRAAVNLGEKGLMELLMEK